MLVREAGDDVAGGPMSRTGMVRQRIPSGDWQPGGPGRRPLGRVGSQ